MHIEPGLLLHSRYVKCSPDRIGLIREFKHGLFCFIMKVFIDNKEIMSASIGPPAMNYGQHQRWLPEQKRRYQLILEPREFLHKIESCFEDFRQEEIADTYEEDDHHHFPELFRWRDLGYPPLEDLLRDESTLLEQLLIYREYEISHALSEYSDHLSEHSYSVNSIDSVRFDKSHITVTGIAYRSAGE